MDSPGLIAVRLRATIEHRLNPVTPSSLPLEPFKHPMTIKSDSILNWSVRNNQSGRLRIYCKELGDSSFLHHHCVITLTRCHWLKGFRINKLNSNLLISFPIHRSQDIFILLDQALSLPIDELGRLSDTSCLGESQHRNSSVGPLTICRVSALGVLLLGEIFFTIPITLIFTIAILLTFPVLNKIWRNRFSLDKMLGDIQDVFFSGVLLSNGLPAEIILETFLSDTRTSFFNLSHSSSNASHDQKFVKDLGSIVHLQLSGSDKDIRELQDAIPGDNYLIENHTHVFIESVVVEGEIVAVTRLADGDWQPHLFHVGSIIKPGAFVVRGNAVLCVLKTFFNHSIYALTSPNDSKSIEELKEEYFDLNFSHKNISRVLKPLTISGGIFLYGLNFGPQALSLLKFNPLEEFILSNSASNLTAIYLMRLHGVLLNNKNVLAKLSKVDHIVISRSCLDRSDGVLTREHINPESFDTPKGYLIRLIAGLQDYLLQNDQIPIWSEQLKHVASPLEISHVILGDMKVDGWLITLSSGEKLQLFKQHQPPEKILKTHHFPLEVRRDNILLGYIELFSRVSESWTAVFEALNELNIDVHVVGSQGYSRMLELVKPLPMNLTNNLHGDYHADERLELVQRLQNDGKTVAYIGYVLEDLPAIIQSDISISIETDIDSIFLSGMTDVSIGPDVNWLPRLLLLSKRNQIANNFNFSFICGTSLLSAIAAATSLITPAAMILLSDIPLLIAEVFSIKAMNSHGVFENNDRKTRVFHPIPQTPSSSHLPTISS